MIFYDMFSLVYLVIGINCNDEIGFYAWFPLCEKQVHVVESGSVRALYLTL